ncbi:MAG: hypothetical protein AB1635_03635 [Acidobacteriota bacterium]
MRAADDISRQPGPALSAGLSQTPDVRALFHTLNNQLGVIVAHAELLEAKAPDDAHRTRAGLVLRAALEAIEAARALGRT